MSSILVCMTRTNEGMVAAWGLSSHVDVASSVNLVNVQVPDVMCGPLLCVARHNASTVVAWGSNSHGGDASSVVLTRVLMPNARCRHFVCAW